MAVAVVAVPIGLIATTLPTGARDVASQISGRDNFLVISEPVTSSKEVFMRTSDLSAKHWDHVAGEVRMKMEAPRMRNKPL